jgi:hypothetical protein
LCRYSCAKKLQSQTVIREKLRKALLYKKKAYNVDTLTAITNTYFQKYPLTSKVPENIPLPQRWNNVEVVLSSSILLLPISPVQILVERARDKLVQKENKTYIDQKLKKTFPHRNKDFVFIRVC